MKPGSGKAPKPAQIALRWKREQEAHRAASSEPMNRSCS